MSIALDILQTYRAPRDVQGRRMSGRPREDRALAILMGACVLIFIAQWPRLAREAFLDPAIAFEARLAGALFAWLMVMPLVFYALAFVVQLLMKIIGAHGGGFVSRMALFWALLASTPLWLLSGLTAGFVGPGIALSVVGVAALAAFVTFWGAGLSVGTGALRKERA